MKRGRKVLTALLTAMSILIILTATAFADPPETGCGTPGEAGHENDRHDWEFVRVDTVKAVQVVWRCKKCGQEHWDVVADTMEEHKASGKHFYLNGWSVTKRATCTAAGEESRTCTICGAVQKRETAKAAHKPVAVAGKAATCTESGISDGTKCSVCGTVIKAQETIAALGHNWKTVTTVPEGLKDGKKVSTCTRCGKSETTVIPAAGGVFQTMRKAPATVSELRITEQANGSTVPGAKGEVFRLTVGVEGGVAPYTYEWFRVGDAVETVSLKAVKESFSKTGEKSGATLKALSASVEAAFTKREVAMFAGKRETVAKIPAEFVPGTVKVGSGTIASCDVSSDGEYYCRITDSLGNYVTSATVRSLIPLHITEQPKMINMRDKEEDWFTVKVEGGKRPYSYQWWYETSDGSERYKIEGETKDTLSAGTRQGMHVYCVITDKEGTTVTSDVVWSYDGDRLVMYRDVDYVTLSVNNPTYELGFKLYKCGIPPYTYEMFACDLNEYLAANGQHAEELLESVYVSGETSETSFTYHVDKPGYYKCVVTDSFGQTSEDAIGIDWADIHELTITKQPTGGKLNDNNKFHLEIEVDMQSGKPPMFIRLMRSHNGETFVALTDWENFEGKYAIDVELTGLYYFDVRDVDGNYAYSDVVSVEYYIGPIWNQVTGTFEIKDKPFTPAYITASVMDGEPPYHYDWRRYPDSEYWPEEDRKPDKLPVNRVIPPATGLPDTKTLTVTVPGYYIVNVTDSRGNSTGWYNVVLTVTYSGSTPLITQEPGTVLTKGFAGESVCDSISCSAMAGTKDRLYYEWLMQRPDGKGYYTVGTGKVWTCPEVTVSTNFGPLYCRVTNMKTGEQVLSSAGMISIRFLQSTREEAITEIEKEIRSYKAKIAKLELMLSRVSDSKRRIILEEIAKCREAIEELQAKCEDLKNGGRP